MSASVAGVRSIVFCDKGSLATAPVDPIAIGIKDKASLVIGNFKEVNTGDGFKLPNMKNYKLDAETLQPSMFYLKKLIAWLNREVDCQVVTEKQGANSDVFKFNAGKELGLDFEYLINQDRRSIKITGEVALARDVFKTHFDSADSEAAIAFAGITGAGKDFNAYRVPSFLAFEAPTGTAIFGANDIIERSLSIKTKPKKDVNNASTVQKLIVSLMLKARDASVAKYITQLNRAISPSILIKESNGSTFYDAFDFNAGTLVQTDEFMIDDEERNILLKYEGEIYVSDITWTYGAAAGGDAADTNGKKGATMKFGY